MKRFTRATFDCATVRTIGSEGAAPIHRTTTISMAFGMAFLVHKISWTDTTAESLSSSAGWLVDDGSPCLAVGPFEFSFLCKHLGYSDAINTGVIQNHGTHHTHQKYGVHKHANKNSL